MITLILLRPLAGANDEIGAFALPKGASYECGPREAGRLVGSGFAKLDDAATDAEGKKAFAEELTKFRKSQQEERRRLRQANAERKNQTPPDLENETDGDGPALTVDDAPTATKKASKSKSLAKS